jgi:hypothetical protein
MTMNMYRLACVYFRRWSKHFVHPVVSLQPHPVTYASVAAISPGNRAGLIDQLLILSDLLLHFDHWEDDVNQFWF